MIKNADFGDTQALLRPRQGYHSLSGSSINLIFSMIPGDSIRMILGIFTKSLI